MTSGGANPITGGQPVGDFFAPYFTINFLTYKQQEITEEGGTPTHGATKTDFTFTDANNRPRQIALGGDDIMQSVRNYITSLEIACPGEAICTISMTIEPPYYAALAIIDDQRVQQESVIVCEWGYLNSGNGDKIKSDLHIFKITKPELDMNGPDVTIRITGTDLFGASAMRREGRVDWPRKRYKTDFSILEALTAKNRMRINTAGLRQTVEVGPGEGLAGPAQQLPHPILKDKQTSEVSGVSDVVHQDIKDWLFFRRICRQNNVTFFTVGNEIFLVDRNVAKVNEPSYRLMYFQQPVRNNDIPMMAFQTNANRDLFMPAEATEVRVAANNPDDNKCTNVNFDPAAAADEQHVGGRTASGRAIHDGQVIQVNGTTTVVPTPSYTENETGAFFGIPFAQQNREEASKQPARVASLIGNVEATATIPGNPNISPMMTVEVRGAGRILGGNFLIKEVVHTLSADGYESMLKLTRDGSTGDQVAGYGINPATGSNTTPASGVDGQPVSPVDQDNA